MSGGFFSLAVLFLLSQSLSLFLFFNLSPKQASAASDVFRTTTYELQTGQFTGLTYTLSLQNPLQNNYFVMISGPSSATASRGPGEDSARVSGDPHSNFATVTSSDQLQLTRGVASNSWIGSLSVVECLIDCQGSGFELKEVLSTSLSAGSANSLQTVTATLSSNYSAQTVPLGGRFGGGISTTSSNADAYATTNGVKIVKQNSNELRFERYGAEARAPGAATIVSYIVEWGSSWNVQNVNVAGTASGSGVNATNEYNTTTISAVSRDSTWVWGGGHARNDGLGDGALGQVITLGDGVNQNTSETSVAVGSELSQNSPGRDFQVYVMELTSLRVDHVFRVLGDQGAASGFQELNLTVDAAQTTETYENASSSVQYTLGQRFPLFYNSSTGNGQAYSRTGAWGLRHTSSTNIAYYRAYSGQNVSGWMQSVDFGGVSFSNVDTRQQAFRWRDDSTDVNSDGGWLAAENGSIAAQEKRTSLRLRFRVANHGSTPEDAARTYELQFGSKVGSAACSDVVSWTGVSDSSSDEFELFSSTHITPDGELLTGNLLSNGDGYSFVSGQARESADTTTAIGPLSAGAYTEIEYALRPTDEAVTGYTYCLRLFDTTAGAELEAYDFYPEVSVASTLLSSTGLGEAGTFSSAANGGWTTVNFSGTYTSPVVVGTTNTHNGESALVFESRNVTATSAEMRVCESEGATANGCDTHASETVGYMVIDAAVAATIDGIEAGTFTANGEADSNSVVTAFSGSYSATPYVFANVNTVNSSEFPIEVVISATSTTSFTAGICDHLQGNNDSCDGSHGNETVGWIAIEPGNEPFQEQFDSGIQNIGNGTWTAVSFSPSFASAPVLIVSSQEDTGGQDVEIDEGRNVTTTGADIRSCEIDTFDTCDSHNADDIAWFAIEPGEFSSDVYLDQDGYRFYQNIDSATPTTPLDSENAALTSVDDGDILHLRIGVQAGAAPIAPTSLTTKLQYGQGTDCSAIGVWSDVGGLGSGTIWRGFNNATPTDGSSLPSSLLDSGGSQPQSYEEANSAAANPNAIAAGNRGEWGWIIENNNADDFTAYCFRMVTDAGGVFHYSRYPKLTTSTGVTNLAPNAPTLLDQEKTSTVSVPVGGVVNENELVFTAEATDQNENDFVELCVEVVEVGQSFTNTETDCGTPETYTATTYPCAPTGNAFYEKYDGIAGTAVADLYADPDYPNNPSSTQTITGGLLESPVNIDDNFGARLSALICPPQDGDYTFWITGDDGSELLLSSDTNPANTTSIASVPGWTNTNEWTKYVEQQSTPITLNAGEYYYIEGVYKEQGGGDHVQIGWTLPDATLERPITGANYSLPTETSAVTTVPGVTPTVTVSIPGLEHGKSYHWQARVRDAGGLYSAWTSFGGNAESEDDFSIDTVAPDAVIFDGATPGADIEFNDGSLDELAANWQAINGTAPDEISGLRLWLDGDDVENDGTDPANGSAITTWYDRSGNSNDIAGTGAAVFDATEQAAAFSDDALPFDDTFDRSGGNGNAHAVYAVVTGNANTATNHVWYETTTPRVAPAENGFLGGGTTLSNNNMWSSHITDRRMLTAEYLSTGTSSAWLGRNLEYQFSETQNFADSQRIVIGDDTTGGNRLEAGEFVHEIIVYNQDLSQGERQSLWEYLECKWSLTDCSVTYEYAIGTSPGGVDVANWTNVGASTSMLANPLTLETSTVYYVSLRVTDVAGNQTIVTSDGQQVAPTITFSTSTSSGGIEFSNLNPGNGFTDTKTSVLTTSTNARNGYEVRAYATGSLENALLDTIGGFDGGTYAAPDTWEPGDTGWGYTSSDTLVGGVNKFNAATCPGGGTGGPCFAPFATTGIGDVVADNLGPVSGSPISNEQFTITHRVTTDAGQEEGTYQTTLIFQATARY